MTGMSRATGVAIAGNDHLAQSIGDILTTPIGTRVMRRDYGSLLPELIDRPMNAKTRLEVFAATAQALQTWEPRFRLTRVAIDMGPDGSAVVTLEGYRLDGATGNVFTSLTIPLRDGAAQLN